MTWDIPQGEVIVHVSMGPPVLALTALALGTVAAARLRALLQARAPPGWLLALGLLPALGVLARLVTTLGVTSDLDGPLLLDVAIATGGGLLSACACSWAFAAAGEDRKRLGRPWLGAVAVACVATQAAVVHAIALTRHRDLPDLVAPPLAIVDVGRSGTFAAAPRPLDDSRSLPETGPWVFDSVTVPGVKAGAVEVTYSARSADALWLAESIRSSVQVVEEVGDPRLPLRVGNRWFYGVRATSDNGGLIGLVAGPSTRDSPDLELAVVGARDLPGGGARSFRLQLQDSSRELSVYAADGALRLIDDKSQSQPLLAQASQGQMVNASDPGAFDFGPIGSSCRCVLAGALRGPSHCAEDSRASDAVQLGIGLLTLGLLAPGASHVEWTLKATRSGPANAPAVPDAPLAVPCGSLELDPAPVADAAPESRPTAAQNAAAAPTWSAGETSLQAQDLFTRSSGLQPTADAPVVACLATYRGNPNSWFILAGKTLLDLTLRIGEAEAVEYRATEDDHDAYLILGPLGLHRGDRVKVQFSERTRGRLEDVTATVTNTLPLRGKRGLAAFECRGVEPAAVEAALAESLASGDSELSRAAEAPTQGAHGRAEALVQARAAVRGAAQLAGWADPRVQRRVERERRISTRPDQVTR